MSDAPERIVIATRESRLALWQAEHVRARLRALYPQCAVELAPMTTRGDQILDRPLAQVGGKGLFIKELEVALLEGRADIAVHSMKDVPMQLEAPFALPVIMAREVPFDAFVSRRYASLDELPPGANVGTSSQRREAQLHAQFPYLSVSSLRGNLDTRLRKLDEGQYDAIILAKAGLLRLGLQERIRGELAAEVSLPAAGQGAMGIECLAARQDVAAWLQPLACAQTTLAVSAERAVARALGGSCQVPLAAFAVVESGQLWLRALVGRIDGSEILRAEARAAVTSVEEAEAMALRVVAELRAQGADAVLAAAQG